MENGASDQLQAGRKLIDPIMAANGFIWEPLFAGKGSGGFFDSGRYVKGDRNLELHFQWSLGMVTYHIALESLSHEEYMRQVAPRGGAQYPGFSKDPQDAFKDLAHDLSLYAQDFLSGSGADFHAAKAAAAKRDGLSGLQKLGREK